MPKPSLTPAEILTFREHAGTVAQTLFADVGPEAVSMRSIARKMGLSAMALYRYFPAGKAEILAAIRARGFTELAGALEAGARRGATVFERLGACLESGCQFGLENQRLYRLMFEYTAPEDIDPNSQVAAARRQALAPVEKLCAEAIEEGEFVGEARMIAHLLIAAAHGIVSFDISRQPYPERYIDPLLQPMLRSLFAGLRAGALG